MKPFLVAVGLAVLLAAPVKADDEGFLTRLREIDIDVSKPSQVINAARGFCADMQSGDTFNDAVHAAYAENHETITFNQALQFVGAAVMFYCPEVWYP